MTFKALIKFTIFLFVISGFSQNGLEKIDLKFEDLSRVEILKEIETLSPYKFYYIDSWFEEERLSRNYRQTAIVHILNDIFSETVINYFFTEDSKIILTQNSIIYNTLPEGFFEDPESDVNQSIKKPVYYEENTPLKATGIETIRIGKESQYDNRKYFELSGVVTNASTREPIANLVISVKNKNINTITDFEGNYKINLPAGRNDLVLKSLGIESLEKRIIIYNDGTFNFTLLENPELLDEVLLDADTDDNIKEAVSGITQINVKEIKTIPLVLGERDVLKVATTLPGISTAGEGASGYNVRGGRVDQNLFLLDGGVIYNPSHFFGLFSAINPFTTGEVDIYKGTIPAEYGGRLSSVFDIESKRGNMKQFSGEGSIGPVTGNLTLEIPIVKEKSALMLSGRGTYSDWILKQLDEESLKNSEASFYDFIGKYNHQINDNNHIEATGYYSKDKFSISSDSTYTYSNTLFSLKWNHRFNENLVGDLILSNSSYNYNIDFENNSARDFDLEYKVQETEIKYVFNHRFSQKHKFTYGLSGKLYNNNPPNIAPKGTNSLVNPTDIQSEQAVESGLFFSDNLDLNDKLSFNLGFRYSFYAFLGPSSQNFYLENLPKTEATLIETKDYDNNEVIETYGGPEFRLSGRYSLTPSLSVKAGYNKSYQFIHTLTTNTTASPTDTWKLSDINIKPQDAQQFSLGLFKNLQGAIYELSLEGYYKVSDNLLDYKVGADLFLNDKIETEVLQGEGKAYGLEFLLRKNKGKLNGWIGYTYSRSLIKLDSEFNEEKVNDGEFFPSNYDKPHDLSVVANYKMTKRFSFSMNFIYQTERPVTFPVGKYEFNDSDYVFYSNRNEFRIPDYIRLDLGLNIEGNHKIKKLAHSFWNISVYNVLGRNNPYSIFFVTEDGEIKAYQSSIFSVPIPTITYNFRF